MSAAYGGADATLDESFTYSAGGNLLSRSRGGLSFSYPGRSAPHPHAPVQVAINGGVRAVTYDANGNVKSDGVRSFTWSGANQLAHVSAAGQGTFFDYGPDGAPDQRRGRPSPSLAGMTGACLTLSGISRWRAIRYAASWPAAGNCIALGRCCRVFDNMVRQTVDAA